MRIRRRRHELHSIQALGDVNELSISGHVEHQPVLREDHGELVYEFVLTCPEPSTRDEMAARDAQQTPETQARAPCTWPPASDRDQAIDAEFHRKGS